MNGDVSRVVDLNDNLSEVSLQQGRPILDADINGPLRWLKENQRMLFGKKHLTPFDNGFKFVADAKRLKLTKGAMLVEGVPCHNVRDAFIRSVNGKVAVLSDVPGDMDLTKLEKEKTYNVYFVAQERELAYSDYLQLEPHAAHLYSSAKRKVDYRIEIEEGGSESVSPAGEPPLLAGRVSQRCVAQYSHNVFRIAMHKVVTVGMDPVYQIKSSANNASTTFPVLSVQADGWITVSLQGRGASELPQTGQWLEVEDGKIQGENETPADLIQVKNVESSGRIFVGPEHQARFTSNHSQIRVWQFFLPNVNKEQIDQHLVVDLAKAEFRIQLIPPERESSNWDLSATFASEKPASSLKPGDTWTFRCNYQAPPNEDVELAFHGGRWPRYKKKLGEFKTKADGSIAALPQEESAADKLAIREPLDFAPEFADGFDANDSLMADDLQSVLRPYDANAPCRAFLPVPKTPAVRSWIASSMLDEVAGVPHDALRRRVLRDLPDGDHDLDAIDADIEMLARHTVHLPTHYA